MQPLSPFKRRMLDVQGYDTVKDEDFGKIAKWMKFPFFLCATLCAVAMALGSVKLLMALAVISTLGAVFKVHPLDLLYNHGIRFITGTGILLPRSGLNRSACALATVWLIGTIAAFNAGFVLVYQLLGWSLVGVAYLVGTLDVCIPSYVFRMFIGFPPKRAKA